jgi:hypothetical protein
MLSQILDRGLDKFHHAPGNISPSPRVLVWSPKSRSVHNNRNMIIHKRINISQEASCHNTNTPKRNTSIVNILITGRIRFLARKNHHRIRRIITLNTRDCLQKRQQTGSCVGNRFTDVCRVGDVELESHGSANHFCGVGHEFVDEDIVVDAVADAATDDANGKGERGHCGDEVVGADDGCYDGGGDDDAADPETGEDEDTPKLVEVVAGSAGKSSAAWRKLD